MDVDCYYSTGTGITDLGVPYRKKHVYQAGLQVIAFTVVLVMTWLELMVKWVAAINSAKDEKKHAFCLPACLHCNLLTSVHVQRGQR